MSDIRNRPEPTFDPRIEELIDIIIDIAQEQATRDHSGIAWGTDVINRLIVLKDQGKP